MFNLLRRDIISGWTVLPGIFMVVPFLITITIWAMVDDFGSIVLPVFTGITSVLVLFFSFILIIIDTGTKSEITFASLPVSRPTIVLARYISSFFLVIYTLAIVLFTILVHQWVFNLEDPALSVLLNFRSFLFLLVGFFLILSFIFPFMYKFGPGKGTLFAISLGIIFPLLVPIIKFIYRALQGAYIFDLSYLIRLAESLLTWISGQSAGVIYLILISVLSLNVFISIVVSMHFYSKLDL